MHRNNPTGMSFKDLYRQSQDSFLVASESALRTHLTEFLDHHLVRIKRGHDGSDLLLIPIPKASLLEFQAFQLEM
jgi:origin recognition complex subunit 2